MDTALTQPSHEGHYVAFLSNGTHGELQNRKAEKRVHLRFFVLLGLTFALISIISLYTIIPWLRSSAPLASTSLNYSPNVLYQNNSRWSKYLKEFEEFIERFKKDYGSLEEKARRFEIYVRNKLFIEMHNAQNYTYTLTINAFADLLTKEFQATQFNGLRPKKTLLKDIKPETDWSLNDIDTSTLPKAVDWRTRGCVTPVKDQQKCGSCWAFSASGAVESANCIKHDVLLSLSEQQLVDCSAAEGNQGCNGGEMDGAFAYMIREKGLCLEEAYPYKAKDGTCTSEKCTAQVKVVKFVDVPHKKESALMAAISMYGPVSVGIQADQIAFQFYHSGVFDAPCGHELNHGVLAVGYGTDPSSGKDYWIIKNSWGAQWGDHGFIKLARQTSSSGGECGVLLEPSYPIVL